MKRVFLLAVIVLVSYVACRDKFDAELESQQQSFLVIEANLNGSGDSTIIRLTRTFTLDDSARLRTESNAVVRVEGRDNTTRPLIGIGNGYYASANLNLIIGNEYRLHITTFGGREYVSDYVKAQVTPPIDSITSEEISGDMWVYANSHDPSNSTRYYRWDYDETWEINSKFYSEYIYENGNVRPRNMPAEQVFFCWKYDASKTVLLANSTNLQNDVIYKAPLTKIPLNSEKVSVRYSINVKQYALNKEAYNFFELMKKNTEQIGGIFTPQPSELKGNVRCVTVPSEYVLGYVTSSTVERKRAFFRVTRPGYYLDCATKIVTTDPNDSTDFYFAHGDYEPYAFNVTDFTYSSSTPLCVDCRERQGSVVRPSYW